MGKFKEGDTVECVSPGDVEQYFCRPIVGEKYQVLIPKTVIGWFMSKHPAYGTMPFREDHFKLVEDLTTAPNDEGVKHDAGKPPVSLIPTVAILGMAKVFAFGAKKYGRHNFRKGMAHSRVLDAAMRHLLAIADGEDTDPESGEPHWAHAMCCLAMYAFFKVTGVGSDDRHNKSAE